MKIREVSYGIEEEGCLQGIYDMKNNRDIRYTAASVAVILKNGSGALLVNATWQKSENIQYSSVMTGMRIVYWKKCSKVYQEARF